MTDHYDRDLLGTLHGLTGCEYMSDLKSDTMRERLQQAMDEVEVAAFPLE